jgi:chemotaxis protein MotB
MGRRKTHREEASEPAWLITFSDLMTLLLTFFVLLLSMATIDERAKREVLGSVSRVFGPGDSLFNPLAERNANINVEPGPMEDKKEDLAPLREMPFDEVEKDLDFRENKYVQVLSINDQVLFLPGGTVLGEGGIALLDRILPYLQRIDYPLLVAGHSAVRREEEANSYSVALASDDMDSTWPLSYHRALAVYQHLTRRGIDPGRLSLEAFGQFHPRYSNNTPEGRRKNRRVDLVLDKRNGDWIDKVEALREKDAPLREMYYKGFRFDLTLPGESSPEGSP